MTGVQTCALPIYWRGKTIQKILKLNKNEIKFLINNTDKSYAELFVIQKIKSFKYNLSEEFEHGFKLADTLYGNNAKKLVFDEILSIDKPSRIRKYLETQINKNKKSYWGLGIALNDFVDMINDMKKLNMPTDKRNIYPKNLNKTHLEISELVKIEGDKLKNDLISRRLIELKNYEVEANGFIVFPARSVEDLINESKELKHCVKSYADKYVDGKTNIFFLRKKDNKEKSLYTIEVSNDLKIIQCRGKQNLSFGTEDLEMKLALDAFKLKLSKKPRRKNHEHRIAN